MFKKPKLTGYFENKSSSIFKADPKVFQCLLENHITYKQY